MKNALIVVNCQNDYFENGPIRNNNFPLQCINSSEIIENINNIIPKFDLVIYVKNSHPENSSSFALENDEDFELKDDVYLFPKNCIENTEGAKLHSNLLFAKTKEFYIIKKGTNNSPYNYSAFKDGNKTTHLKELLKEKEIEQLFFCGNLAELDILDSVRDAVKNGFETNIITDCCNYFTDDFQSTLETFIYEDAWILNSETLKVFLKH